MSPPPPRPLWSRPPPAPAHHQAGQEASPGRSRRLESCRCSGCEIFAREPSFNLRVKLYFIHWWCILLCTSGRSSSVPERWPPDPEPDWQLTGAVGGTATRCTHGKNICDSQKYLRLVTGNMAGRTCCGSAAGRGWAAVAGWGGSTPCLATGWAGRGRGCWSPATTTPASTGSATRCGPPSASRRPHPGAPALGTGNTCSNVWPCFNIFRKQPALYFTL